MGDPPLDTLVDVPIPHDAIVPCEKCHCYHASDRACPPGLTLAERKLLAIALLAVTSREADCVLRIVEKLGIARELLECGAEYCGKALAPEPARADPGEKAARVIDAHFPEATVRKSAVYAGHGGGIVTMPRSENVAQIPDAVKMPCPCCAEPCWLRNTISAGVRAACTVCALKGHSQILVRYEVGPGVPVVQWAEPIRADALFDEAAVAATEADHRDCPPGCARDHERKGTH